ncbi:uncharacterized protein [Diabrotica undecimpunctata]|uniref:uncharacterized protein n=1 Tax=Diabrotica undecimpunctata TaxID=50387 RepID=UPI003B6347B6
MDSNFKPPNGIRFDQNASQNFEKFLDSFKIYMEAADLASKQESRKIAIFLNLAGKEAQDIFKTFKLSDEERKQYNVVINAFKTYCSPLKNETYDRFLFFTRIQEEDEEFDNFMKDVKLLAKNCNFDSLEDSRIRDRLVSGIRDQALQKRLLRIPNLTAAEAENQCRIAEVSTFQVKSLRKNAEVDEIRYNRPSRSKTLERPAEAVCNNQYNCFKCGTKHGPRSCPAFGKICNNCRKPNHFSSMHDRKLDYSKKRSSTVYNISAETSTSESDGEPYIDELTLDNVKNNNKGNIWTIDILINNEFVNFKLDSGANCNCLPLKFVKSLKFVDKIVENNLELNTYGNNRVIAIGTGKIPYQYKIVLHKKAEPVTSSCRRVPDALKPRLKEALKDLEKRGIISKVEEPTEWVNNIVIVEKPSGALRICLDPVHLNKWICLDQFPIPTIDELSIKLKDKKIFTVLDLKEGFYRLLLILKVRMNEKIFGDLPIGIYFDDFIISASTEEEHDEIIKDVIKRAERSGIRFNKNKIQCKVSEVSYICQVFSSEGVKPGTEYITAVLMLKEPKNKKELLRILEIQTDASQHGIGCSLLQEGRPVAFASRGLTDTETRWAQIEKEYLAICYSLNKFHQFVYGRKVIIKSDHKPLVAINKKDIWKISSRLQRLKLKMLKYDFEVQYLPGKHMYIADILSRSFIKTPVKDDKEMREIVHSVKFDLLVSVERIEEIRAATNNDQILSQIKKFCQTEWPNRKSILEQGQSVMIKKDNHWVPGEVVQEHSTPRSYLVGEDRDKVLR